MKHPVTHLALIMLGATLIVFTPSAEGITLQAGAGIGYAAPSGDYAGTTVDFYSGAKYGMSGGVNVHAKGRVALGDFHVAAEIGYSMFSNSGDAEASGQGDVEISNKVVSIKVGPEYMIKIPAVPLTPYIAANLALNTISGEVTFGGVSSVPSGTFDIKSAVRFGLGIGAGAVFKINPLMSLDLGISYNILNLIGKKFEVVDQSNPGRIDSYTRLNDAADPVAVDGSDHIIGSSRSINDIQVGLSVLFGI